MIEILTKKNSVIEHSRTANLREWERTVLVWVKEGTAISAINLTWLLGHIKTDLNNARAKIIDGALADRRKLWKEKAKVGLSYMPWSTTAHKLGKDVRRPDLGIVALKDDQGSIVTGKKRDDVVRNYMRRMWGTATDGFNWALQLETITRVAPETTMEDMLNCQIAPQEVEECIKELKNGAPGDDMIPNSVWKLLGKEGVIRMANMFEKHRLVGKFPRSWKYSDILHLAIKFVIGQPCLLQQQGQWFMIIYPLQ